MDIKFKISAAENVPRSLEWDFVKLMRTLANGKTYDNVTAAAGSITMSKNLSDGGISKKVCLKVKTTVPFCLHDEV